jgi:hypothetical protein
MRASRTPAGSDLEQAYLHALRRDPCTYCGAASRQLDHARPLLRFLLAAPLLNELDRVKADLAAIGT